MRTVGWLFLLLAALLVRATFKGRVMEIPKDFGDMLLGALTGDFEAVREAEARTGEGISPVAMAAAPAEGGSAAVGSAVANAANSATAAAKGAALVAECKRLGTGKPYIWGGTFASGRGGDCSGLVWRALYNLGIYKGGRFTTYTFPAVSKKFAVPVSTPQAGDIAVWQRGGVTGHMGVVVAPGRLFSAVGRAHGVKETPINWFSGRLTYYRLK